MDSHREVGARSWRTRNVWAFSWASFFSDMGHEWVTALLPGLLATIAAPPLALGVIEGVSNLAQSWSGLWGGRQADFNPRRVDVIRVGYLLTGLKAAVGFVTFWPLIVVLRTLAWFGRGARGPVRNALIAEDVEPGYRGRAFGFREAFDTAGALIGPLIAAGLVTAVGYRAAIGWSAIPALITMGVIVWGVRDPRPRGRWPAGRGQRAADGPMSPAFARFFWATGWFTSGFAAPTFFILWLLQNRLGWAGFSPSTTAILFYAVHNAVYAAASFPAGMVADRGWTFRLLLGGYGLWALAMAGFFWAPVTPLAAAGLFVATGLATALIETTQKSYAVSLLPDSARGRGLGRLAAVTGVGQLIAGLLLGALWSLGLPRAGFLAMAILALVGALVLAQTRRADQKAF